MLIQLNIPNEFAQEYYSTRFKETLHRLSADAHLLAGNYEQETANMLIEAFDESIPTDTLLTDSERYKISDIFQDHYLMGLHDIAEEDETCKSLFQKVGLI